MLHSVCSACDDSRGGCHYCRDIWVTRPVEAFHDAPVRIMRPCSEDMSTQEALRNPSPFTFLQMSTPGGTKRLNHVFFKASASPLKVMIFSVHKGMRSYAAGPRWGASCTIKKHKCERICYLSYAVKPFDKTYIQKAAY